MHKMENSPWLLFNGHPHPNKLAPATVCFGMPLAATQLPPGAKELASERDHLLLLLHNFSKGSCETTEFTSIDLQSCLPEQGKSLQKEQAEEQDSNLVAGIPSMLEKKK